MSEEITPSRADASKSGDVRNFDIGFKANSSQNYSTHQDTYKSYRGSYRSQGGQRGRGGKYNNYQRRNDDMFEGRNNRYTNQRDEFSKSKPSSMYSAAESVYDMLSKEKNGAPLRDGPNDNRNARSHEENSGLQRNTPNDYRNIRCHEQNSGQQRNTLNDHRNARSHEQNSDQQRDRPNVYRNPNTYNNQNKKGNFKKYSNDTKEKSLDGPKYKKIKYPMGEDGPNNAGPSQKRHLNKFGGSNKSFKDNKFNKQRSLLNEISNVLVQVKSFPELFSYDEMCEELLNENPIDNSVEKSKMEVKSAEKPKRAPYLKNGVIVRNDRGQGNIPNEFKRRRKPGRLTLLNRVRKGIPLNSDEDDDEYIEVRKKKKTSEEKKKKILDIIAKCRESRERERDKSKTTQTTDKENVLIRNNDYCDSSHSKQNLSLSSEDSDEDYRNQRKSDAHKLSDNLGNDLSKFIAKKSHTEKDLCLMDVKKIVQSRTDSNTNTTTAEKSSVLSDKQDLLDQMKSLDMNDTSTLDKKDNENMINICESPPSNERSFCQQNVSNENNTIKVANKHSFEEEQHRASCSTNEVSIASVEKKTGIHSELSNQLEVALENTNKGEIPIRVYNTDNVNNIEKNHEAEEESNIEEKTKETEEFTNEEGDVDVKDLQEVDAKSAKKIDVKHTKDIDVKEFLKEVEVKNSEEIHENIPIEVDIKDSEEIDTISAEEVEEIDMDNAGEDDVKYVEEENSEDEVEDEEETEEDETSEDSDSSDDNVKVKLLKSLTKQLIAEGKEANSKQVIELLQEKLKNLSLKEAQARNSCTEERKQPTMQGEPNNSDSHEATEISFRKEEITLVSEGAGDSSVIVVCDDSSDDDSDEDDGDDDEFPVLIIKS